MPQGGRASSCVWCKKPTIEGQRGEDGGWVALCYGCHAERKRVLKGGGVTKVTPWETKRYEPKT